MTRDSSKPMAVAHIRSRHYSCRLFVTNDLQEQEQHQKQEQGHGKENCVKKYDAVQWSTLRQILLIRYVGRPDNNG